MFRNMKLASKMIGGFLIVLALMLVVGASGFRGLFSVADRVEKSEDVNRLATMILEARRHEKNFVIRHDDSYVKQVDDIVGALTTQAHATRAKFTDPTNLAQMDAVLKAADEYHKSFKTFVAMEKKKGELMESMRAESAETMKELEGIRADLKKQLELVLTGEIEAAQVTDRVTKADDANRMIKWYLDVRKIEKEVIISGGDKKWLEEHAAVMKNISDLAADLKSRLRTQENKDRVDRVLAAVHGYQTEFDGFIEQILGQKKAEAVMVQTARDVQKQCEDALRNQKDKLAKESGLAKWTMGLVAGIGLALGLILAFGITRSITRPIARIIEGLSEGADQVASAAGQVSAASQQLAEGASEQAAGVEETSSSLEEMASMTRQNADNARQANSLMDETKSTVDRAGRSMAEMNRAMGDISRSGQEIGKIIKTIDEIAFQTNLLALNAAVEAARAGEAGAGFAVVADEVRNLAMRAAEAAKNTAGLIEGTITKIQQGTTLVREAGDSFTAVAQNAGKVGELIGEISAASSEQAQGIDQVNQAVAQMDSVTQRNAANAEESASASEELNAQADSMREMVNDLAALVGGAILHERAPQAVVRRRIEIPAKTAGMTASRIQKNLIAKTPVKSSKALLVRPPVPTKTSPPAQPAKSQGNRADDLIPMDDDL